MLLPHHDGSRLYVSEQTPQLDQEVSVRVRVPQGSPYTGVYLRWLNDADIEISEARCIATNEAERWYEATLVAHNPVTRYRFMLIRGDGKAFDWLNASGVHAYDVSDACDFQLTVFPASPSWNTDGVVYQIFPDRFARSEDSAGRHGPQWAIPTSWGTVPSATGERSGREWYGGDLKGIEEHLDYIKGLGVTTVYLTPFFTAGSIHRYDAMTFERVDPLLGGDAALASLVRACHERGMHLVGDLTLNHTGDKHEWFRKALADPGSEEHDFYIWHGDDYVGWKGFSSLPKLNWGSAALVRRMIDGPRSDAGRWLGGSEGLDGWRIDVGNMTGRYGAEDHNHEVAVAMRRTVSECTRGDGVLIAEHMRDAAMDLAGDGWQGVMNYAGFTAPVWTWLADPHTKLEYMELKTPIPRRSGVQVVRALREFMAHIPWKVALSQWNALDTHDTARIATVLAGDSRLLGVAVGLMSTFPGVPMVFAGDERDAQGATGEQSRVSMDWGSGDAAHAQTLRRYRELLALRARHSALRTGGMRWVEVGDEAFAFVREDGQERLLVCLSRQDDQVITVDRSVSGQTAPQSLYGDATIADLGSRGWQIRIAKPSCCILKLGDLPVPRW